jgi:hypothetical protein
MFLILNIVGAETILFGFDEVWTPVMFCAFQDFIWRSTVTETLCLRAAKAASIAY